jgi:streptomycin 6-kinase
LSLPFDFTPTEELPCGHCSRVFADETRVLKVPFQGEELTSGFRAALMLAEIGLGPRIFASEPETGAILMERVIPGTKLSESDLSEAERITVFADIVRQMKSANLTSLQSTEVYGKAGLMPLESYVTGHSPLRSRLLETAKARVFLHGDLHHENILLGQRGWIPIDPKGLIGDPSFEASAWLRNPLNLTPCGPDLAGLLDERLRFLGAEFGWDCDRMLAWTLLDRGEEELGEPAEWSDFRNYLRIINEG